MKASDLDRVRRSAAVATLESLLTIANSVTADLVDRLGAFDGARDRRREMDEGDRFRLDIAETALAEAVREAGPTHSRGMTWSVTPRGQLIATLGGMF